MTPYLSLLKGMEAARDSTERARQGTDIIGYATKYLDAGFSITPINSLDKSGMGSWLEWQNRPMTHDEARHCFGADREWYYHWLIECTKKNGTYRASTPRWAAQRTKDAVLGIALVCGPVSDRIVVEIDSKRAHDALTRTSGPWTTTQRVKSRKGIHYHFRYPSNFPYRLGQWVGLHRDPKKSHKIDLRGVASLANLPPSVHRGLPAGTFDPERASAAELSNPANWLVQPGFYRWIDGPTHANAVDWLRSDTLAELPGWLRSRFEKHFAPPAVRRYEYATDDDKKMRLAARMAQIASEMNALPAGNRNAQMLEIGRRIGFCVGHGGDAQYALTLIEGTAVGPLRPHAKTALAAMRWGSEHAAR